MLISDRERYLFDAAPGNQQLNRLHQPDLPSPGLKIGADLPAECPFQGPYAHSSRGAHRLQRDANGRVCNDSFPDRERSAIYRERYARGHRGGFLQLVNEYVTKCALDSIAVSELAETHDCKDEFTKQRADVEHPARSGQRGDGWP